MNLKQNDSVCVERSHASENAPVNVLKYNYPKIFRAAKIERYDVQMKGGEKMVKICDGWYYSADENEYTLIHEYEYESIDFQTKQKTGEIKTRRVEIGYFTTLSAMLTKLVTILGKEKIANGEITTLSEHVEELRRIKTELENDILPF